jgi:hypothetical protein
MNEQEVIRALGVPPGDYRSRDVVCGFYVGRMPQGVVRDWYFDSATVMIWLQDGKVHDVYVCEPHPRDETWLQWLRATLGI